jgi:hypothetical protein
MDRYEQSGSRLAHNARFSQLSSSPCPPFPGSPSVRVGFVPVRVRRVCRREPRPDRGNGQAATSSGVIGSHGPSTGCPSMVTLRMCSAIE